MKSTGKRFEENWKASVPKNMFYYRFRDSAGTWGGNDNLRFTPSNIADCLLWNSETLYLLELKSCKGSSLPFNNIIGNKTKIKQIDNLINASEFANTIVGLVIEFSEKNKCYFIEISNFKTYLDTTDRKSLPIQYCADNGIEIDIKQLKINRQFNIEKFIKDSVKLI